MTVTIEVKPELADRGRDIAEREGRALEAVVSEAAEIGLETLDRKAREYSQRNSMADALALVKARDAATPQSTRTTNAADDLEAIRSKRTDWH